MWISLLGRTLLAIAVSLSLFACSLLAFVGLLATSNESLIDQSVFAGVRFGDRAMYPEIVVWIMLAGFLSAVFSALTLPFAFFAKIRANEMWFVALATLASGVAESFVGGYLLTD